MAAITVNDLTAPKATASRRAPVFTLGSALRWLGHDCFSALVDTLRALVWFLRRGPLSRPFSAETRVLVDAIEIGDTVTAIRRIIYGVNGCTRRDAIEVRYQPRCALDDRPERAIPHRIPVALLMGYQPTRTDEVSEPSARDLDTINGATPW